MINLLPEQQKKIIAEDRRKRLISILGVVFLVFFISLALVCFSIEIYISGRLKAQEIILEQKKKEFREEEIKALEQKISFANQSLARIEEIYGQRVSVVEILEEINDLLPFGTYLVKFSQEGRVVTIAGFAPTRNALLQFRENLLNRKGFKDIVFPGEPWIKSNNIDFFVSFNIERSKQWSG